MPKLIFDLPNSISAVNIVEDGPGYDLPKGAKSLLLLRYVLENDKVVDRYAGLSDEDAIAALAAEQAAEV